MTSPMKRLAQAASFLSVLALSATLCAVSGCRLLRRPTAHRENLALVEPYPRHDDPDAFVFNDLPVRLYFISQSPPPGTRVLQPVKARSAVVARGRTCREAGLEGLRKLQRIAQRYEADAVVNLRSTWEGRQLGDNLTFGCALVDDELVLVWEGALAMMPEPPPIEDDDAKEPDEVADEDAKGASGRLRELDSLYYQGLITREEYLERRRAILDEL